MSSGLDTPLPLALGTFWFDRGEPAGVDAALGAYLGAGGRLLDTARVYGTSEDALGDWLRAHGEVAGLRIVTKGAHHDLASGRPRLGADDVLADARRSCELLGRAPDVWLLHRDDPARPIQEIAAALVEVLDEGLAASVGVSNWSVERASRLHEALAARGGLVAISDEFGLARPAPSSDGSRRLTPAALSWAREHGVRELAWSSQSGGWFAGAPRPRFEQPENHRRREILRAVASDAGVRPEALLARWTATASPAILPVATSRSADRLATLLADVRDASLDPVVDRLVAAVDPAGALGRPLLTDGE